MLNLLLGALKMSSPRPICISQPLLSLCTSGTNMQHCNTIYCHKILSCHRGTLRCSLAVSRCWLKIIHFLSRVFDAPEWSNKTGISTFLASENQSPWAILPCNINCIKQRVAVSVHTILTCYRQMTRPTPGHSLNGRSMASRYTNNHLLNCFLSN